MYSIIFALLDQMPLTTKGLHLHYIYIYLTIGPQISPYFSCLQAPEPDFLAMRTYIHVFTADVYMWPLALNVLYIFRLVDQMP